MYSLVSAPVLGFDLARLDGGSATAELLLAALSLAPDDLAVLADRLPDQDIRAGLWRAVDAAALRQVTVRRLVGADPATTVAVLERAPIGTLDALLHCVRHDVLDWTWAAEGDGAGQSETAARASALLCDALAASYLRAELAAPTRRRLAAGWVAATRRVPARPADLGPHHRPISRLLAGLSTIQPADLVRLGHAADRIRGGPGWSTAMHSASWAVYLSGRVRPAAAAQLLLVRAVQDAGARVGDLAAGGWNALSGVVQALVVRDMLDAKTAQRLFDPYLAAFGPAGLG